MRPFCKALCSFEPSSRGYHLKRGEMPLHDAVEINCINGATTKNQGAGVKYMDLGEYVDDCGCYLT